MIFFPMFLIFRKISREEFVNNAKPKPKRSKELKNKAKLAFNAFDSNQDGFVSKAELWKASNNLTMEQVKRNN